MILNGKYDEATIYTDVVEDEAVRQVQKFIDSPISVGAHVRVMPDVHSGKDCVIGFTAKLTNKIVPNIIGVDISCGVYAWLLDIADPMLKDLDMYVRLNIPSGRNIYKEHPDYDIDQEFLHDVIEVCKMTGQSLDYVLNSMGTLGGGNHYLEMSKGISGGYWISVHSGSRNFGLRIANHFQKLAENSVNKSERDEVIDELKKQYSGPELGRQIANLPKTDHSFYYISGSALADYLYASSVASKFAHKSRNIMLRKIAHFLGGSAQRRYDVIESVHNYIDLEDNIIRKGAISAREDKKLIIPLNMRDGSIIGIGKGNPEWNFSAPHGAGRLMSRSKARELISLDKFQESMEGIYTTSVETSTIDEAPFAYKAPEDILKYLAPTVDVLEVINPIWNFKAKD